MEDDRLLSLEAPISMPYPVSLEVPYPLMSSEVPYPLMSRTLPYSLVSIPLSFIGTKLSTVIDVVPLNLVPYNVIERSLNNVISLSLYKVQTLVPLNVINVINVVPLSFIEVVSPYGDTYGCMVVVCTVVPLKVLYNVSTLYKLSTYKALVPARYLGGSEQPTHGWVGPTHVRSMGIYTIESI